MDRIQQSAVSPIGSKALSPHDPYEGKTRSENVCGIKRLTDRSKRV